MTITIRTCRQAVENFRNRLQDCIAADSRHLKEVVFKTLCKKLDRLLNRTI